jgi:uncharacterized protein (DUF983 family)
MTDEHSATAPPIPVTQTLWRGFQGRCPHCGKGRMFGSFLKVSHNCPDCAEPLYFHRADDLPAYLVIVIVGHVVVGLTLWLEQTHQASILTHAVIELPLTVILSLALLQPIKGAVVALQWHAGMHGFPGVLAQRRG